MAVKLNAGVVNASLDGLKLSEEAEIVTVEALKLI
jgi:hypothetical protein